MRELAVWQARERPENGFIGGIDLVEDGFVGGVDPGEDGVVSDLVIRFL